ncbi:hypothetical protein AADZ91_07570 [Colwelliaceae bacterium 6441]
MNKIFRIFLLSTLSVFFVVGCSKPFEIQLQPEVKVFLSDDREKVIQLTANEPAYKELAQWLDEHKTGWYPTSGNYPGGVYIVSGDYGIQVTQRRIIIYSTERSKPEAIYVQEIKDVALSKIKKIGQSD